MEKKRILIVDDDENIAELISLYLMKECFETKIALDGEEALNIFKEYNPHLIMLDIMLPGIDGVELLRRIRSSSEFGDLPIIMATAKGAEYDKIQSLDLGADDYIVKPFGVMELISRIKAVLRRYRPAKNEDLLQMGGIILNIDERTLSVDGERVSLTYKEFELLRLFMSHPGMAYTRDQLFAYVWEMDYAGETRTVDMHVRTLRQKLGKYGELIETVRHVGYRMEKIQ